METSMKTENNRAKEPAGPIPVGVIGNGQEYKLSLIPFSRGSDQEFAFPKKGRPLTGWDDVWHDGSGTWDNNHPGWDNGGTPWGNYGDGWDNHGAASRKITADSPLGSLIQIRRDNEQYGFVSNLKTSVVFLADAQTIEVLGSLLESPLKRLAREHPEVLSAIC